MNSPSQFRPDPPYSLASTDWADDYNQIKTLGAVNSAVRTPAQTDTALFWTDHVGSQYSRTFRALAVARNLDISDTARLFATLYTTGADAAIGCWDAKYHYKFWRPVTAIPNGSDRWEPGHSSRSIVAASSRNAESSRIPEPWFTECGLAARWSRSVAPRGAFARTLAA